MGHETHKHKKYGFMLLFALYKQQMLPRIELKSSDLYVNHAFTYCLGWNAYYFFH